MALFVFSYLESCFTVNELLMWLCLCNTQNVKEMVNQRLRLEYTGVGNLTWQDSSDVLSQTFSITVPFQSQFGCCGKFIKLDF